MKKWLPAFLFLGFTIAAQAGQLNTQKFEPAFNAIKARKGISPESRALQAQCPQGKKKDVFERCVDDCSGPNLKAKDFGEGCECEAGFKQNMAVFTKLQCIPDHVPNAEKDGPSSVGFDFPPMSIGDFPKGNNEIDPITGGSAPPRLNQAVIDRLATPVIAKPSITTEPAATPQKDSVIKTKALTTSPAPKATLPPNNLSR